MGGWGLAVFVVPAPNGCAWWLLLAAPPNDSEGWAALQGPVPVLLEEPGVGHQLRANAVELGQHMLEALARPHQERDAWHGLGCPTPVSVDAPAVPVGRQLGHRIGRHLAHRRQEFVLSTKVGYGVEGVPDWTYDCIVQGVERALRLMRTRQV